jgi:hypothetical protein
MVLLTVARVQRALEGASPLRGAPRCLGVRFAEMPFEAGA